MENGCFIIEDKCFDNWPIFSDPSRRSIDWIRTFHKDKTLFIVRHSVIQIILYLTKISYLFYYRN